MAEDTDHDRLVKIETKLDIFLNDHETRIRKLERWVWVIAAGLGSSGGVVTNLLMR